MEHMDHNQGMLRTPTPSDLEPQHALKAVEQ